MKFVAEIGMNHNGNFDLCYELIRQAKLSGADIVKFQIGWRDKPGEINQIKEKEIKNFIKWAKYFEIELMFSIISNEAFELIKQFKFNYYKVASRTLIDNIELAKKIIELNKPTFVSLGMWEDKNKLPFDNANVKYLWCNSKYPTHLEDLSKFPKNFLNQKISGYSDHSIGIENCLLAIARGCDVIEKHFTLDKSNQTIRDHTLSATPNEFKTMTEIGRDLFKKVNSGI